MSELSIKSYGKINLSLDITGVREDGYHEIDSIMYGIKMPDTVTVSWEERANGGIEILLEVDKPYLPTDEKNLAYKAALIMVKRFGEGKSGVISIDIKKKLPVAAGLAGGSSNGAAVIVLLNRLWDLKLNTRELCELGEALGADVPFCILVQNTRYACARCKGTGAELYPIKTKFKKHVVLVKPNFGVSTREAYEGYDKSPAKVHPDSDEIARALEEVDENKVYKNMINVLESYTIMSYPRVQEVKDVLGETGPEYVLMTGSGPTVFALYDSEYRAKKACLFMREKGYESYWTMTL